MNNVIVYGPQGCGKTTHGEALRKHFGMERVVDENEFGADWTRDLNNNLILATEDHPALRFLGVRHSFADAMRAAGLETRK